MMRTKRTAIECLVWMVAMLPLPGLVMAQAPATADRFPPAGRLVEVGGHRLHLNCTGHGGPTVVIENGTGDFSLDWSLVPSFNVNRFLLESHPSLKPSLLEGDVFSHV